jgi:organic hydroperoxide reductase OsmC/OhrA
MAREHHFAARLVWSGAEHGPTRDYRSYSREYPKFLGDAGKHNPEDLLVIALSACHLLSYLAACAQAGIEVVAYEDQASGLMAIKDRKMRFVEVTLAPHVTIAAGDLEQARALHDKAHEDCFIANSVNFPVLHMPTVTRA